MKKPFYTFFYFSSTTILLNMYYFKGWYLYNGNLCKGNEKAFLCPYGKFQIFKNLST